MREIEKAISRYDGNTTYAKMANILSILLSPLFNKKPSCYVAEVIPEIQQALRKKPSENSDKKRVAEAHIRHGISLGLLESTVSGGTVAHHGIKRKVDETMRIALTPLGRAYCAAHRKKDSGFEKFLLTYALLEHDFDMYALLVTSMTKGGERSVIKDKFVEKVATIYHQRKQWLKEKKPINLKDFFQKYAQEKDSRTERTLHHHFALRVLWSQHMDHTYETKGMLHITDSGKSLAERISNQIKKNSMFWIAPTPECVKKIGIIDTQTEEVFSAWDILRPPGEETIPDDEIIEKTAKFMDLAYNDIRLCVFNQAPLGAVIPYVHFLEHELKQKVNIKKTFQSVLHVHRDRFSCLLGAVPQNSVYQLKPRKT